MNFRSSTAELRVPIFLTFSLTALDALLFDRSVERICWNNTFETIVIALYVPVFLRATMDTSGYTNRGGFVALNLFNCFVMAIALRYGPDLTPKAIKDS